MRSSLAWRLGALISAGSLAACAGAPPAPPVGPVAAVTVDAATAARLVSDYRRGLGLAPVTVDPALMAVARRQAEAMAAADHLSHEVAGTLSARLRAARVPEGFAVENVSAGYPSLEAALAGWRASPGHDANLRDPHVRRLGIAAASAPETRYKTFWSLDMTD